MIDWLNQNAAAVKSIAMVGTCIASVGSWVCTVWADRKARKRFESVHGEGQNGNNVQ
jgi:hypothetical protein